MTCDIFPFLLKLANPIIILGNIVAIHFLVHYIILRDHIIVKLIR